MAYTLNLTHDDIRAIDFASDRYGWSSCLQDIGVEEGDNILEEHQAWDLQSYINEDTEDGRTSIPLAARCLSEKLWDFVDQIV